MVDRAKVYFTDLRAKPGKNLLDKLKKLVLEAGIKEIDFHVHIDTKILFFIFC